MLAFDLLAIAGSALAASAGEGSSSNSQLFVSSYAGTVTTLELSQSDGAYSVKSIASDNGCQPSPSWLTLDKDNHALYCIDENLNEGYPDGKGSITSYELLDDGSLNQTARVSTSAGPVSGVRYGSKVPALAVAHYDGGAVSDNKVTFDASYQGVGDQIQEIFFEDPDNDHGHEVILDPTGKFIVVPDLGADKIRTFAIDATTSELTQKTAHELPAGTGPRHGAFWSPNEFQDTYFFLVAELSNSLRSFKVSYTSDGELSFEELEKTTTYGGPDASVPAGAAAAEIAVTPDNRFVVVSNRNDTTVDPPSDPLTTYEISNNGSLQFKQLYRSGGPFPRQFSINKAGDLIAAGFDDGRVAFLRRDIDSGDIVENVATAYIDGTITCAIWNE